MFDKIKQAFLSKTVWLVVITFLLNGISAIKNLVQPQWLPLVDGILSVLIILAKLFPSQEYSK